MTFPATFQAVSDALQGDDFFLPSHRRIWEAIAAVARRGTPPDAVMVADEMRLSGSLAAVEDGELGLLKMGGDASIPELISAYVAKVRAKADLRRLIAACASAASAAYSSDDAASVIEDLGAQLVKLAVAGSRDLTPVKDHIDGVLDAIEAREKAGKPITGVATGITAIDRLTGGLHRGNIVVVAARPGVGKTAWALNVLKHHAEHGGAGLFFSLEMTRDEVIERLLVMGSRIDSERLRNGQVGQQGWGALNRAAVELGKATLYIVDDLHSMRQIAPVCRRFRARHAQGQGPDAPLIVIDYLQLMHTARGMSRAEGVGEMSRGLKALAKQLQCPIVAISQLNRESEKEGRPPRLSDLRESGDIEQDADIVIFPHNPETRDLDGKPVPRVEDGRIDAIVAKNRNGRTGVVGMHWIGRLYTFGNVANEWE
jgi:replicative DNA helicase